MQHSIEPVIEELLERLPIYAVQLGELLFELRDLVPPLAEGLGGFWLGFRLNIVRTVPQAVVTFAMYEQLSKLLMRRVFVSAGGASAAPPSTQQDSGALMRTRSESRA